ncbi:hypothetical protein KS419_06315, partial [Bacillus tamaricis]
ITSGLFGSQKAASVKVLPVTFARDQGACAFLIPKKTRLFCVNVVHHFIPMGGVCDVCMPMKFNLA